MRRIVILATIAFALFTGINLLELTRSGEPVDGVSLLLDFADTALLVVAIAVIAFIAIEARDMARQRAGLAESLEKARAEGDRWRQTAQVYLKGLGEAITAQFRTWRLSSGEAEIAMLLLKGLSHREIAGLRATSEATVRQQARAIYQKSGLGSRAELAAYFLEDLTPPPVAADTGVVTPIKRA
jgi:DNA-binding NarL/FixJ family response regulator